MEKKEYSVSEAVRLIGVESHVLRYWEEELQVKIRRTSQGHRIYSQEDIDTFCKVRELKEHGLQLKAIRYLLDKTGGSMTKAEPAEQIFEIENDEESFDEAEENGRRNIQRKTEETLRREMRENPVREDDDFAENEERFRKKGRIWEEIREIFEEDRETDYFEEREKTNKSSKKEDGEESLLTDDDSDFVYDVAITPVPEDDFDKFRQFEEILKRIIGELIEEKNQKMEQSLRKVMREELDQFFLLYQDVASEAAAEKESTAKRGFFRNFLDFLRR